MPKSPRLITALGTILQPLVLQALNAAMDDGKNAAGPPYEVPNWIPLVPAGPVLSGVDGRVFRMDDAERVVNKTRLPIALDWDHTSAMGPFSSRPGKAAARIVEMEIRNDEIWGRCEWTKEGRASVEAGEYLYISPVVHLAGLYEDEPPEVKFLTSAALVNSPNFQQLPALNRQEIFMGPEKDTTAAADPQAAPAIDPATSEPGTTEPAAAASQAGAATPQIDMVPRAELEAAMNNMNALSAQLTEERQAREADRQAQRDAEINAALDQAIADRKILPTSRDYYLTQCKAEGGLEAFKVHVDSLPQMLPDSGLDNAPQPGPVNMNGPAKIERLTPKQEAFCSMSGIDPAKYLKTLQEDAAKAALQQGAAA